MGCSFGTKDALAYAKSQGIYTIVTDHLTPDQQPLKKQADEDWMIDVKDLDTLEQQCRQAGVTGIFGGTSEFCLDQTKALCGRLGLPFYASDAGWAASRDKELFKQACTACGLKVPRQYKIRADGSLPADLAWPVMVKPVDACAQLGLSICHNAEELKQGYAAALEHSASGRVIVEDYIQGDELCSMYWIQDGKPVLLELMECVHTPVEQTSRFAYIGFQSRFVQEYNRQEAGKVETMFKKWGCQQGPAYLQMIRRGGTYYFLELGYRLNSVPSWPIEAAMKGVDVIKGTVDLALGRHTLVQLQTREPLWGAVYFLWSRPGTIARVEGADKVEDLGLARILYQTYGPGETVPREMSMGRILFRLGMFASSPREMQACLEGIRKYLHVYDTKGREMLFYLEDPDTMHAGGMEGERL